MNTFTNLILHCTLSFLSFFVPKKKGVFIFGCGNGIGFQGNPKYLFLHLHAKREPGKKVFWSTSCKKTLNLLNEKNLPVVYKHSFRAFFLLLKAEYLFIEKGPDDVYYIPNIIGRFNFIQTWHGVALKYIGADAIIESKKGLRHFILSVPFLNKAAMKLRLFTQHKYKLICSTSDFTKEILVKSFHNKNVLTTGYPRNDLFFRPELSLERVSDKLNLSNYTQVWLYAPTYRDNYERVKPFSDQDWAKMDVMLIERNFVLLVKKHPLEKKIEIPSSLRNVIEVSELVFDVQEILLHCHGLVSDYSSICSDFSLKGNPIIFFTYDIDEYMKKCRGFYASPRQVFPGPFAFTASDVTSLICEAGNWFEDAKHKAKYEAYRDLYNEFVDGKSIERILSEIK